MCEDMKKNTQTPFYIRNCLRISRIYYISLIKCLDEKY